MISMSEILQGIKTPNNFRKYMLGSKYYTLIIAVCCIFGYLGCTLLGYAFLQDADFEIYNISTCGTFGFILVSMICLGLFPICLECDILKHEYTAEYSKSSISTAKNALSLLLITMGAISMIIVVSAYMYPVLAMKLYLGLLRDIYASFCLFYGVLNLYTLLCLVDYNLYGNSHNIITGCIRKMKEEGTIPV